MAEHLTLDASPNTVHWAFFDASLPAIGTIESGDTVTLNTVSGGPDVLPDDSFEILPEHREIHAKVTPGGAGTS